MLEILWLQGDASHEQAAADLDVFGLADAFEEFRTFSLREFGLDPVGYLGLPGLGWDGLLLLMKKRDLKPMDTLQDPEMYRFFEKAIRGGNSFVGLRRNVANHPNAEGYDPTQKIRDKHNLRTGPTEKL